MHEETDNNRFKNRLDFDLYKLGIEARVTSHYPTQEFKQVKYGFKLLSLYVGYALYGMFFRPKPEEYLKHLLKNPSTLYDLVKPERTDNILGDISKSIDLQNNDNTIIEDVINELRKHNSEDPRIKLLECAKTTPDPTNLDLSNPTDVVPLNLEEGIVAIIQHLDEYIAEIKSNNEASPDLSAFFDSSGDDMINSSGNNAENFHVAPPPVKMAADLEASKESLQQTQNLQDRSIMASTEAVVDLTDRLNDPQENEKNFPVPPPVKIDPDPHNINPEDRSSQMAADLEASKKSLQPTQESPASSLMKPTEAGGLMDLLEDLQERKIRLELELQKNKDFTKQQELKELNQEIKDMEQQIATPSPSPNQREP